MSTKKKNVIVVICMIMLSFSMTARTLSVENALQRAFANTHKTRSPFNAKLLSTVNDSNGVTAVYVVDNKNRILVLSASDAAPALLGYFDNPIDYRQVPTQLSAMLQDFANQIGYAECIGINADQTNWNEIERPSVEPLLKTAWGQQEPYNSLCPIVNGDRAVTGCLPTAMAQVMAYHGWPERGEGKAEYTLFNGQRLTMDFGDIEFDWDKMKHHYEYDTPLDEAEAAATLMAACGYSVTAEYGAMTSADTPNAVRALIENFRYDKGCKIISQSEVENIEAWDSLIYENLSNGMPVIYRGSDDVMGHAFVCDGYKDGLFHFDWGWNGVCNGYFRTTALIPYRNNETDEYPYGNDIYYNFYMNNRIVSGICPADGRENPVKGGKSELYSYHVFMSGEGAGMTLTLTEETMLTGKEGFYFENSEGEFYFLEADHRDENKILIDEIMIPDGWYMTSPAIRDESGRLRKMTSIDANCYCLYIERGHVAGYEKYELIPELTEIKTCNGLRYGEPYCINALATNKTPKTIFAELFVAFYNVIDSNTKYHQQRGRTFVKLYPGEQKEIEISSLLKFKNPNDFIPGDYLMKVFSIKGISIREIAETTVTIKEMESAEFTDVLIPEYFYGLDDEITLQTNRHIIGVPEITIIHADTQERAGSLHGDTNVIHQNNGTKINWRGILKGRNGDRLKPGKYLMRVKAINIDQVFEIEVTNPFEIEMIDQELTLMTHAETSVKVVNLTDRKTEGALYLLMEQDGIQYQLGCINNLCFDAGEKLDINVEYFVNGNILPGEKIVETRLELNTPLHIGYSQYLPIRVVETSGVESVLKNEENSIIFGINGVRVSDNDEKNGIYIIKKGKKSIKILKR